MLRGAGICDMSRSGEDRRRYGTVAIALSLALALVPCAASADGGHVVANVWNTTITIDPFAGAEAGYDSNPDQRRDGKGSIYEMGQVGAKLSGRRRDTELYNAYVRGRFYEFNDLDNPHRYDIDVALGTRIDLSPANVLKFGTSFYRDAISLQSADIYRTFAELIHEGAEYQVRVNAHSHTELSLKNPPMPPGITQDVFDTTRNAAFDFSKNGATISLLTFRNATISPFLIASLADVYYMNQSPRALLDRDADDMYAVLGLRMRMMSSLVLDVGGRVNRREFAQDGMDDFTRGFLDARLTWYVSPTFTLRGIVERQIKEPSTAFGLADDVITYEVSAQKVDGPWAYFARAYFDQVRPIGEHYTFDKYNWSAGISYQISPTVELYANYAGKLVKEQVEDETYTRHQIGAGVRAKF